MSSEVLGDAPIPTCVLRGEVVSWANRALGQLLGDDAARLVGQPLARFIPPEELPRLTSRRARRLQDEPEPTVCESVVLTVDGRRLPVELHVATRGTRWSASCSTSASAAGIARGWTRSPAWARGPDLRLGEAAPAGPGRVLVVDDQRNMRITTAIVLRQAGSEVAEAVAAAERRSIEAALLRCDGDLGRVARDLAISPTTLWRKMKRLAIEAGAAS